MFLTGTLLNVATVLVGTVVGLLVGSRLPARVHGTLTSGLGLFTLVLGVSMGLTVFTDPAAQPGDDLAVLAAVLLGAALGELLRLHDGLEALGAWFQRRLERGERPSRVADAFVTASLVFCVGPLTILGSLANGLSGDVQLLAIKSLLDGVASVAFAAALGPGVALAAVTVLVVQGTIAGAAFVIREAMDAATILAITAAGGVILLGVGLRLLDVKDLRVASFLPALLLAPLFVRLAELVAGERRRIDTALMRAFAKRIVSKAGVEGIVAFGLPLGGLPAGPFGDGPMGIAGKIDDGNAARRAGDATSLAVLRALGLANDPLPGPLVDYAAPPVVDPRGERSGDVRAVFRLS